MVKTFWDNEGLRGSLWNDLPVIPSLEERAAKLIDFKALVLNKASSLYNFIEIK
ncbi:hypothetical protein [uncultured Arcticibacterium sp.]|uniref:hypothetical protein n=1 Tax=uncultured Arcticibacterium sp. TaxID=2173042 RepID=UPI0030F84F7D